MVLNARTATAKDFDEAAQKHANGFWANLILSGVIFYFFEWWALIPGIFCIFSIVRSISATVQAGKLRDGTYKIPNPNNGIDDSEEQK